MRRLIFGIRAAWVTRSGPCLHPFYCVLLANQRKYLRSEHEEIR